MAKIIVTLGDRMMREIPLLKERITIGRRPHNDIVLDDLAISGEHAVIVTTDLDPFLEDLNSTNGTKVNGQPVKKHYLQHEDCIELALYRLRFVAQETDKLSALGRTKSGIGPWLKVLDGPKAGSEIAVNKEITSIGTPECTAVILKRPDGYYLVHVEGIQCPTLNGLLVGAKPHKLNDHDIIDMAGSRVQFISQ